MASQFISLPLGSSAPSGSAGGDLSGTFPNPTVSDAQYPHRYTLAQRYALTPTDGQLAYDTTLRCLFIYNVDRWFPAQPIDPRCGFLVEEDWINNVNTGNTNFLITGNAGSDSGVLFDAATGAVGQLFLEQSSAGPGYATAYYGNAYSLGAQKLFFDTRAYISALSTGAQEYIATIGFGDSTSDTAYASGMIFSYDRATDGDFWSCQTTSNSVTQKTVTAIAPVGGIYNSFSVAYYSNSVKYFIGGTLVATHTANIPGAGDLIGPKIKIVKTVGATARRIITDYFTAYSFFDTRR